jgi:alkanesulfonate monooxygenase SsuD/methylene tetrahydromethanopterin reductase-like flavin-dependent oxidoreductase (luciferase family)
MAGTGLNPLQFGVSIVPEAGSVDEARRVAARADELGLDLFGIQDHPYQRRFLDTFALIGDLLARTERLRVFPDVANLPLRGAAMIAKAAASLDVLSGGRFELGLGAGGFWDAIAAMGGPRRGAGESVDALADAIRVIRGFWRGDGDVQGEYYSIRGLHPGPPPVHDIGIWLGVYKPRGLRLVGALADGWVPSLPYAPPETIPELARHIEEAAAAAGRNPGELRRVYNVMGDMPAEQLAEWATELRFDTFVYWPQGDVVRETERFAEETAPAVRAAVG